jgi:hypothetical protein
MSDALEASKQDGPHALLAKTVGSWEGTARTWFEPDELADTSPVKGSFRSVLDGRFVVHEYEGPLMGHSMKGVALHGYTLHEKRFETAWIDSCHNATRIMLSLGEQGAWSGGDVGSVLGSYPAPEGPDWGWRTEIDVSGAPERLVVRHYNVTPDGQEAIGVEFDYTRVA